MEIEQKMECLRDMGFEAVYPMTMLPFAERDGVRLFVDEIYQNEWEGILQIIEMQEEINRAV